MHLFASLAVTIGGAGNSLLNLERKRMAGMEHVVAVRAHWDRASTQPNSQWSELVLRGWAVSCDCLTNTGCCCRTFHLQPIEVAQKSELPNPQLDNVDNVDIRHDEF